jgi:DHA1 family inner membrane transport protein
LTLRAGRPNAALDTTRHPTLALWSLSLAYFAMGTSAIALVGLIHDIAAAYAVSKPAIAAVVTLFALTFAVLAPLLQVAAGRLPRRTLLLAGLLTMAVASLWTALATSYASLTAARVLLALGSAAVGPVASSLGAGLVPPERQGRALAIVFSGMTFATVLGLPLATWAGALLGWRWAFAGLAVASVLIALLVAVVVGDRRPAPAVSLASFGQVLRHRAAAWAIAMAMCQMAAIFSLYALVAPFLEQRFGVEPRLLPLAFLLAGTFSVLGNLAVGRLGDRLGTSRTLALSTGSLLAAFLIVLLLPAHPAVGMAAFAVWSMLGMTFYAPQQKRLIELAPALRNLLLAMNASALYVGMSMGAAAAAQAWLHVGAWSLPAVAATFVVAGMLAFRASRRAERAGAGGLPAEARPL